MKKISVLFLLLMFALTLSGTSYSATTAKKKATKPKFPIYKEVAPKVVPKTTPAVEPAKIRKSMFFVEGGLGGGSGVIELCYGREISDNMMLSGGIGYGVGSGFGVVVLDPLRVNYNMGTFTVGGGLNYAMYSSASITNVPGLSGKIPSQNIFGGELFAAKNIRDKISGRIGYSTALGFRASLGYEF